MIVKEWLSEPHRLSFVSISVDMIRVELQGLRIFMTTYYLMPNFVPLTMFMQCLWVVVPFNMPHAAVHFSMVDEQCSLLDKFQPLLTVNFEKKDDYLK